MANINVEDQFWLDLLGVAAVMGDSDRAAGQALRFIRFSQEKHKKGKMISEEEFKRSGFDEALIPIFAERVEGGIQAVGAEKHFAWLRKKVEAGRAGGIKSGEARRATDQQDEAERSTRKQNEAKASKPQQAEPIPIPIPYCINSSLSQERDNARAPARVDRGSPTTRPEGGLEGGWTLDAIKLAVPILTREQWRRKFPDEEWMNQELERAFEHFSLVPGETPRSAGKWVQKLNSWLHNGWTRRKRESEQRSETDWSKVFGGGGAG